MLMLYSQYVKKIYKFDLLKLSVIIFSKKKET